MNFSLRQCCVPEGATDSIFPEIEELFDEDFDLYGALTRIAPPKADSDFRSVMDWLYVSIHPEAKKECLAFYEEQGPPLRAIISEEHRLRAQARIIALLLEAYRDFNKERERKWQRGSWRLLCQYARMAA